jgi:hypothetical protein
MGLACVHPEIQKSPPFVVDPAFAGTGVKIRMVHGEIDFLTIYPNISSFPAF